MKIFGIIVVFAVAWSLVGCVFQKINEQDMLGQYRANLPGGGSETLDLLPHGKCAQEIRLTGGEVYNAEGTWTYDNARKRLFLTGTRQSLTPESKLNPDLAAAPSELMLSTPVSRGLAGSIYIMLHEGIDYRKVNEPTPGN